MVNAIGSHVRRAGPKQGRRRIPPTARLNRAMRKARSMIRQAAAEEPPITARLAVEDGPGFAASVSGGRIKVSTGVVERLDQLWSQLWPTALLADARGATSPAGCADLSLTWLLLHELMHVRLRHHRLLDSARLVEVGTPDDVRRAPAAALGELLDPSRLSRCLELQADDDASRVLLGAYDEADASAFRVRAVAIFVVMALIERENARLGNRNVTHPAAVTRLFMLMATMMTVWGDGQVERDIRDDGHTYIPASALPEDRFEAYRQTVFRPLLSDVTLVVAAAGAMTFIDDLQDEGPLLRDLTTALFEPALSSELLATQAAREWLDLAPTNQKVLRFLGYI